MTRWDPSATECLPEYMKGVYTMVYDTINEMAGEAQNAQGRDTLNYAREAVCTIINHVFVSLRLEVVPWVIDYRIWLCVCSGRLVLIRICKRQSGSPLVIYHHLRSTTKTGKLALLIAYAHCSRF